MPHYCVTTSPQDGGAHEVHDVRSIFACVPRPAQRLDLGYHPSCTSAVAAAQRVFERVNGCTWCAHACHAG